MPYNDDDSSSFFDYRPKQAVPEGEEPPEQLQQDTSSRMSNHSSATPPYDHHESDDDDDESGDDDAGSLAELTNYSRDSHGSGVDLHPHHKRGIRPGGGGNNNNYAGHHQLGSSDSRQRKKYSDEENQTSFDNNQPHQRHKSSSRNKRSSKQRSSSRSGGSSSSASSSGTCACISNLFEGVNFKTVLLCVIAMAMVMKMHHPSLHANLHHGMQQQQRSTSLTSTNGELPKSHPSHPDFDADTPSEKLQKLLESPDATPDEIQAAVKARLEEHASGLDPNETKGGPSAELVQQRTEKRLRKREEEHEKNVAELNAKLAGNGGEEGGVEEGGEQQQQPGIPPPPPPPPLDGQQPGIPPPQPQGQLYQQYDPSQQQVQQPYMQFPQGGQMQPQNFQQQQQGYFQNGYNVPPQQQPGVGVAPPLPQQQQQQQQVGMPPNNYAVSNQSPLEWQQQMQQQQQVPLQGDPAQQATPEGGVPPPPPPPDAAAVPAVVPPAFDTAVTADQVPLVGPGAESALATTSSFALEELVNFKDSWDPFEKTDIPVFWHIPKAGGSSIKDAMGGCHRFVQATEFGITDGHDADTEVAIVYPRVPGDADTDRSPFVNIDSSTVAGIQRAKAMGFADAQLADVVVSPFVFELNDLFTQTAKGRFFSVFRHPIDRAVSMFYYIRVADWEPSYKPELKDWTLEQYAQSDIVENNWMTRQLSNQLGGDLTEENLSKAMEVVRRKFLVGLMSQIEPTMARAEKFFRWTFHVNPPNQDACRDRLMSGGANSNKANKKEGPKEGDEAWTLLAHQNNFDLQLYSYIEQLFVEQEDFVKELPDNFRNVDATCCKCYPATFPPEGFECPVPVKNGDPGV